MITTDDPREAAARYRAAQTGEGDGTPPEEEPRPMTQAERAAVVEIAIAQAVRRGEFDDLPGAGKPLQGLERGHDPDWWIRRKIETEQLRGLGPPAIALRVENAELDDRLDALGRESDVREVLEDFNNRIIEARRQLLGGPPVVTPVRDVEANIEAWRERREAAAATAEALAAPRSSRRRWWRRGR
ncbi:DUF1992 domain-containing protein [Microbacterium limosum]|uniref:DUF1992 domain-containing protein n=1 Tax=Microbacterium limosum TaxID=3079935 RepID=A0AAU0MGA6_9MICO|nr:DUF1992 domain-containing protein [Microbacterium sp. Y20]WOQ69225.1 DUF1992 domain-containing protein [Microbacterium sp. Y20]